MPSGDQPFRMFGSWGELYQLLAINIEPEASFRGHPVVADCNRVFNNGRQLVWCGVSVTVVVSILTDVL